MPFNPTPELPALDYKAFGPQLENLLTAIANRISRDGNSTVLSVRGSALVLEALMRIAMNDFRTIKFISTDNPSPPLQPEFVLSLPPIIRSLVDALFLATYLFDDLGRRVPSYFKGGWREISEELERYNGLYGKDAEWREWLEEFQRGVEHLKIEAEISTSEAANRKLVAYWPTPSQMLRDQSLVAERRQFLEYVEAWYYKSYSSHMHLSFPGLIMRSAALLASNQADSNRSWRLDKQRSDAMAVTSVLALAIASEVNLGLGDGYEKQLAYVWTILAGYFGLAKELWDRRYSTVCN